MIGGRSALLAAGAGLGYGNWTGNYENVSLLMRGYSTPALVPLDESPTPKAIATFGGAFNTRAVVKHGTSAMAFDGSGDYFETSANAGFDFGTGDFTIEFWMYASAQALAPIVHQTNLFNSQGWVLWNYDNSNVNTVTRRLTFMLNGASFALTTPSDAYSDNTWTHIAVVKNGTGANNIKIYSNGTSLVSGTYATALNSSTTPLMVGGIINGQSWNDTRYLNGYIDDLRITKGVARYVSNFTPPAAELPANATDDPSYNSVSLLLRNGAPTGPLLPADESPTPKTITVFENAGISETTFKYGDSSLVFDGDGDYATTPANADFEFGTGDFTVEFWIRFSSIPSAIIPIISLGVGAAGSVSGSTPFYSAWSIFFSSGAFRLYRFDGAETSYAFNTNLSTSAWYHVAFARSGTSLRCFVNGTQIGTTQSTSLSYNKINNDPLQIGLFRTGVGGSTYNYLHGNIDDIRITKSVARYTRNFLPPPAELPAI